MFFRQRTAANATLSYLFGCAGHQMAIAVDVVAGDEDWFCPRRPNFDPPCRLNFDPGIGAGIA